MDTALPETPSAGSPSMSLSGRLMNMYAIPEDVFDAVCRAETCVWNWLLPILLSGLVGIIFTLVALSQPNVKQQIQEKLDQQVQKLVDSGKLSTTDAEAQRGQMDQFGLTMAKIAGASVAVVMGFAIVFGIGLVLKLLALWPFHRSVSYMKAVEITGLSGMISVLGTIIQLLLVIITGSMYATPGPVLLMGEIDPQNKMHLALAAINLATLWWLLVLGIGLARLAKISVASAFTTLLLLWVLMRVPIIVFGLGSGSF